MKIKKSISNVLLKKLHENQQNKYKIFSYNIKAISAYYLLFLPNKKGTQSLANNT